MANERRSIPTDFSSRLGHVESELSDLKSAVSGLGATQNRILDSLERAEIDRSGIQARLSQPPPTTNWVGIGTLIFLAAGAVTAYVTGKVSEQAARVTELREDVRYVDSQIRLQDREFNERISHSESELKLANKIMNDIDAYGSRRWIQRPGGSTPD